MSAPRSQRGAIRDAEKVVKAYAWAEHELEELRELAREAYYGDKKKVPPSRVHDRLSNRVQECKALLKKARSELRRVRGDEAEEDEEEP